MPPYVYFIKSGDLVKIGKTVNIEHRFKSYLLHNPGVSLLYLSNNLNEVEVHRKFKSLRTTGEWFKLTDDIYKYIDDCKNTNDVVLDNDIIIKKYIRSDRISTSDILSPNEIDKIINEITRPYLKTLFNISLFTGMRYVEIQRLYNHLEWINDDVIVLPGGKSIGETRNSIERRIPIPLQIVREIPRFYKNPSPPHHKVWGENLKRWSEHANVNKYVVPKSIRSTMISWMFVANIPSIEIGYRVGIFDARELDYYKNQINFTDGEEKEIKKRLENVKI